MFIRYLNYDASYLNDSKNQGVPFCGRFTFNDK